MASVNKVIIVGNLGADPEVRQFDNGGKIATISVATSERWTDKQTGEPREHTEWHRIIFNNRLADIAEQYLKKGSQVYVEGSLRTRKWQDQQGQDRYSTEIRADSMQMLGHKNSGFGNQNDYQNPYPAGNNYPNNYQNHGQQGYQGGNQFPNQGQFAPQGQPNYPQNNMAPQGIPTPNHFPQNNPHAYNAPVNPPTNMNNPPTANHFGNAPMNNSPMPNNNPPTPSQLDDDDDMPF